MCVFCQIIKGEISSYKVTETVDTYAFLDIKPTAVGHTLVVPKNHYQDIEDIPVEELSALIASVKEVGGRLKDKLGCPGYNIIVNNGQAAGQVVPHLHFHVIPRQPGDGLEPWPGREYAEGEAEDILGKLLS
jgi:histidine triad (HIT) family protein